MEHRKAFLTAIRPNGDTTYTISHTTIPQVSIGPLVLNNFYTSYAIGTEPPGVLHHLGSKFFSQYRVLFDFEHQRMYVKPNRPSVPTPPTAKAATPGPAQ